MEMYFKTCVHTRYVWIKTRKYSTALSPVLVVVVVSGCQAEVRTNTRTLFSARDIMALCSGHGKRLSIRKYATSTST